MSWMTNEDVDFLMENCSEIFSFSDMEYTAEGTFKDSHQTMYKSDTAKQISSTYKTALKNMKSGDFTNAIKGFNSSIKLADKLRNEINSIKEPKSDVELKKDNDENMVDAYKELLQLYIPIWSLGYLIYMINLNNQPYAKVTDKSRRTYDDKLSKATGNEYKRQCLQALNLFKVKCEDNIKLCKQGISTPTNR